MCNRFFVPDFLFDFYTVRGSIGTPSARSNGSRPRTYNSNFAQNRQCQAVLRWTKANSEWVECHELGRRLAVGPVMDTTAFGLLLNNLLWKIGRLNWATFCTLLATFHDKRLATMQRWYTPITGWSTGRTLVRPISHGPPDAVR